MMTKQKDELDLDFGDITGEPIKAEAKVEEVFTPERPKPIGYEIALKGTEPGTYKFKDLAELSGEEYIEWMAWVYPLPNGREGDPKFFENRANKVRVFENILRFHQASMFYSKKDESVIIN